MKSRVVLLRKALTAIMLVAAIPIWGLERIVFTPQWTAQAEFAGYYVAKEKGFYRDVGLDVDIVHPTLPRPVADRINTGEFHATTLQLGQALEVIDQGTPLVNLLQTSMNEGLVIISAHGKKTHTQKEASIATSQTSYVHLAMCISKKEGL